MLSKKKKLEGKKLGEKSESIVQIYVIVCFSYNLIPRNACDLTVKLLSLSSIGKHSFLPCLISESAKL